MKGDSFWENLAKGFTEAGTPFEDGSSTSTGDSDGYQTLFSDNVEGKGLVIPPRSILRMRVNKEEMPLSEVCFISKTHQHEKFKEWAKEMLAQPGMSKKLLELGIMRLITQARRTAVERNRRT